MCYASECDFVNECICVLVESEFVSVRMYTVL